VVKPLTCFSDFFSSFTIGVWLSVVLIVIVDFKICF